LKNNDIYTKTENILERIRNRNKRLSEKRILEIFTRIPAIKEIRSQIFADALNQSRMSVIKNADDIALLKRKNDESLYKIRTLLEMNGYAPDHLDTLHDCAICNDTGYTERNNTRNRCSCFYIHLAEVIYTLPGFELPEGISFSVFDASLFEDFDSLSIKQKSDIVTQIKNDLESFCHSGKIKNYYLFGKTGTGKSFFLISMARKLLENQIPSLYLTSNNLFRITQEYKASVFSDEKPDPFLYNYIYSVQVLLIDDLGTDSNTPSKYSELLELINQRLQKKRPTIIAGNLSPLDLKKMYDERVYSRIIGSFEPIKLPGDDLRLVIKRRSNKVQQVSGSADNGF
jgi:DNA replication protein DnaC